MKKTIQALKDIMWALSITQFFRNLNWKCHAENMQVELEHQHYQRDLVNSVMNTAYTTKQAKELYVDLILKEVAPKIG